MFRGRDNSQRESTFTGNKTISINPQIILTVKPKIAPRMIRLSGVVAEAGEIANPSSGKNSITRKRTRA